MVAGVEDDENAARFAGQLHLSAADRARRTTARPKSRATRQNRDQARTGTGFTRPTAPVIREVAIGVAITQADPAQQLATKGGALGNAPFTMAVMAPIPHHTP